tara:strand:+ start:176 stop:1081 length:906 start_codon:yes stop_codon:yes gene_type:complete
MTEVKMQYIASISGGKDSAAMALHLIEQGIEFEPVFFDTGWEHPDVYEYLRGELSDKIGTVREIIPKSPELTPEKEEIARHYEERLGHHSAFIRIMLHKTIFPTRLVRYCTHELKIKVIKALVKEYEYPVSCVGVRAAESRARAKLPERELSTSLGCMVWRPLIKWSEQDVIDIHHRHNLAPNPLYLKGAARVGCAPCIYSGKKSIRFFAEVYGQRLDLIRDLEKSMLDLATKRVEEKGEELRSPPTFFYGKGTKGATHIDDAIAWSKTSHGGSQSTMFREDEIEPSCMSWGLCDTGGIDD